MKKNKIVKNQARQGDVLFIRVDSIPDNVKQIPGNEVTAAEGEVTGHHHTISGGATGYASTVPEKPTGRILAEFVEVRQDGAALTHQEHDAISFSPGNYRSIRQTEYTPAALKRVSD